MPVNVLYLIGWLEIGGAERVVVSLARGLDRGRFVPAVGCIHRTGALASELVRHDVPVIDIGKRTGFDPGVLRKLLRVIRAQRPTIVHTHLWTANFWGRIAARLAAVPVVIATEHSVDTWKSRGRLVADRLLARWTDRVVFVTAPVRDFYVRRARISRAKAVTIRNGVDLPEHTARPAARQTRLALGIPVDAPLVGFVGRLNEEKNVDLLLDALARARRSHPDLRALIVGEGPCRPALEARARALGLDETVLFLGQRTDVSAILQALDVFALSSRREGLPLTVLEALAVGTPVVAPAIGGIPEAVQDGVNGFLVPPGSPAALADRLVALLTAPDRQAMGHAGARLVRERFGLDRMLQETTRLYEECLAAKGASPVISDARYHDVALEERSR